MPSALRSPVALRETLPEHPGGPTATWSVTLIGSFALEDGRQRLIRLPSRAVTLLLARLAMWPERSHPREELVELLWPGVAAAVGRNRLRQALSVLRSIVEPPGRGLWPVVMADRLGLRAAPGALDSDYARLRRAARDAGSDHAKAAAVTAAALVADGAELLPGLTDEWVIDERHQLAAWLQTIAARAASRPPVPAEAAPAPRPAAIGAAAAEPAASRMPPRLATLPSYLTRWIGTEQAARDVIELLARERLVVLRGPGGVGKTRLAIEAARWAAGTRAAGSRAAAAFELIAFVPLAGCSTRAQALDAIALALRAGVEPRAGDGTGADDTPIVQALALRPTLLVLDNVEPLIDSIRPDLARWLAELPGLCLLATSRVALRIDGERDWPVAPLALPPPLPAARGPAVADKAAPPWAALADNPAIEMFVDRARAVRADFHLGEANAPLLQAIVHALGGLPLAIELAAARVRGIGLADMCTMLGRPSAGTAIAAGAVDATGLALDLLSRSGPRAGGDPRHASMRDVLDWSWRRLTTTEQRALQALAVFDESATLAAVAAVSGFDAATTALALDGLVAASMVVFDPGPGSAAGRWRAEPLVREHALAAADADTRRTLRAAHGRWCLRWAEALGPTPAPTAVRTELPNFLKALGNAAGDGDPQRALQIAVAARRAFDAVSLPAGATRLLAEAASTLDRACDDNAALAADAAVVHALLAHAAVEAGRGEAARTHAEEALRRAPAASHAWLEAAWAQARVCVRLLAQVERAAELVAQALPLARSLGALAVQNRLLGLEAVCAFRLRRDPAEILALQRARLATLVAEHADRPQMPADALQALRADALVGVVLALGFARQPDRRQQLLLLAEARDNAAAAGLTGLLAFAESITNYVHADLRQWAEGAAAARRCLAAAWADEEWRAWFYGMWNLPRTLVGAGQAETAATLMGFAASFYARRFGRLGWDDEREARRTRRWAAARIGRMAVQAAWARGQGLSMSEAAALADAAAASAAAG